MSQCKNGKLGFHDWKVLEDSSSLLAEQCTNCGEIKRYNKSKGGCDNKDYHDSHQKDFIQPADPRFKEIYN